MKKGIHYALFRSVPSCLCGRSSASTISSWRITQSCSSYCFLYIFPCAGQLNAMLMHTPSYLTICSLHVHQAADECWSYEYEWGKTCSATFTSSSLFLHVPTLLINHCCLGDICQFRPIPCYCRQTWHNCEVCNVYLTHMLPMANSNNKTFVQKTFSLTQHRKREGDANAHW